MGDFHAAGRGEVWSGEMSKAKKVFAFLAIFRAAFRAIASGTKTTKDDDIADKIDAGAELAEGVVDAATEIAKDDAQE